MKKMLNYATIVRKLANLPSLPIVVIKLQKIIEDSDVGSKEVARVVETDTALVARVLKLVNSSFYGFSRRIKSVAEAIAILGLNTIQQLVLAAGVFETLKTKNGLADMSEIWHHSVGVGVIAKHLLHGADRDTQNEALMCGILHDVGYLVMAKIDLDAFALFYSQQELAPNLKKEAEIFGINHQQLGEMLAKKWNFPESITCTIARHHSPDRAMQKTKTMVSAINIADMLSHATMAVTKPGLKVSEFNHNAWQALNLDYKELDGILYKALDEIGETKQLIHEM